MYIRTPTIPLLSTHSFSCTTFVLPGSHTRWSRSYSFGTVCLPDRKILNLDDVLYASRFAYDRNTNLTESPKPRTIIRSSKLARLRRNSRSKMLTRGTCFPSVSPTTFLIPTHRAALKHHPDRVPSDSPERPARTRRFQAINDAYYTLSDPARRRDYDSTRPFTASSSATDDATGAQDSGTGNFPWSSFFSNGASAKQKTEEEFSDAQFGSVFEEMMQDEGLAEGDARPTGKFWSLVGGLSGGAMGFIVANFPGAIAGAVAGNRLGAIRDRRGMSVYSVFQVSLQSYAKASEKADL